MNKYRQKEWEGQSRGIPRWNGRRMQEQRQRGFHGEMQAEQNEGRINEQRNDRWRDWEPRREGRWKNQGDEESQMNDRRQSRDGARPHYTSVAWQHAGYKTARERPVERSGLYSRHRRDEEPRDNCERDGQYAWSAERSRTWHQQRYDERNQQPRRPQQAGDARAPMHGANFWQFRQWEEPFESRRSYSEALVEGRRQAWL